MPYERVEDTDTNLEKMSHVTYRYWCPTESAWVLETRLASDNPPTVCVNDSATFTSGSLTIVSFAEQIEEVEFLNHTDFSNATVVGLSHTSLGDIGTHTHPQIDTHIDDATIHRSINDSSTSTTALWSASKINTQLAGKSNTGHTHVAADVTDFTSTTNSLFDTRLATKSTSNLAEGSNLYYTTARFDTRLAAKTTDNLGEGSTNLYYTEARVSANSAVAASTAHAASTSNPHSVTKSQVGLGNVANTKCNFSATTAPSTSDDTSSGYSVGSVWINTSTGREYVCVDATASAAVWRRLDISAHADLSGIGSNTHAQIDSHIADATIHRSINDSGTSATDLWSASKITSSLAGKSNTGHTHTASEVTDFSSAADARISAQKGAANGLATLDGNSKIPTSQLPAIAITSVTVVADITARDALTPDQGDVAKVTDSDGAGHTQTYIYSGSAWIDIQETSDVMSVNGQTGSVSLTTTNISEGSNLYYTTSRFDTRLAAKTTDNLTEGSSNLYYTTARFDSRLSSKTTDNLAEGSTNLYYTEARVSANSSVAANTTHRGRTDNPHSVTKSQVGLSNVENLKVNLTATTNPGASNDSGSGYAVGSRWINTSSGREYVCVDATASAAVWRRTDINNTSDVTEGSNLYYTEGRVSANSAVAASTAHSARTDNPHSTTKAQVGLGNVADLKVNLTATTNPSVSNDSGSGYAIGSRWFNTTLLQEYVCLDASSGAAIWKPTTKQFDQISVEFSTNSSTYVVARTYLYRGASYRTIKSVRVIAAHSSATSGYTFDVRLIDYDNSGAKVAEATGLSGTTKAIRDLGTITNVPTSDHVFEVQIRRSGTTSGTNLVTLHTLAFEFN